MKEEKARPAPIRVECFDRPAEAEAIDLSLTKVIEGLRARYVSRLVREENIQRYYHGGEWSHPAHEQDVTTQTHRIEILWTIPWQKLVDNDLGIIVSSLRPLSEDIDRQFAERFYGMVGDAAAAVGNVVDNKVEGNIGNSFLAMWRKIEIGVDRDGKVALPQLHMHPKTWETVKAALDEQPSEFHAEIDQIIREKSAVALERERARRAKFVRQN